MSALVKSRHRRVFRQCPALPQTRTLKLSRVMCALCDGPRPGEAAGHPCAGSAEKEISLSIAPRIPIAVVVALPGERFRFVMFAFVSVRRIGKDRSDIVCRRCFFRDWRV